MSRPLVITDCDEVLLYMVAPFRDWLGETHGVDLRHERRRFRPRHDKLPRQRRAGCTAKTSGGCSTCSSTARCIASRPVPGVIDAIAALRAHADVVVLTNLKDHRQEARRRQLAGTWPRPAVYHQPGAERPGAAGDPRRIPPARAIFIDDLAQHHGSVAELVPHVEPPALCAEPTARAAHRLRARRRPRPRPDRRLDAAPALAAGRSPSRRNRRTTSKRTCMTDAEIDAKLAELGLSLPEPAAPVAAYVPVVIAGGLAHVSGQLPFIDGVLVKGRLGEDVDAGDGYEAARACGLMILAQLRAALGSLDRVERIVKLGAFVNSTGDFTDQPKVANGASELMAAVFGDAGKHARSAVGVPVLPLGAAVEVDAIVAVRAD
jgi:enamine deaminase RidA (YjgF/YER057c/UK114 family)